LSRLFKDSNKQSNKQTERHKEDSGHRVQAKGALVKTVEKDPRFVFLS